MTSPFTLAGFMEAAEGRAKAYAGAFLMAQERLTRVRDFARSLASVPDASVSARARAVAVEADARLVAQRSLDASAMSALGAAADIKAELARPPFDTMRSANLTDLLTAPRSREVIADMAAKVQGVTSRLASFIKEASAHLARVDELELRAEGLANEAQGVGIRASFKAVGSGITGTLAGVLGPLATPLGLAAGVVAAVALFPELMAFWSRPKRSGDRGSRRRS